MKTSVRFFFFLLLITGYLFSGCEPADQPSTGDDIRDPFVGVWQFVESGGYKSTQSQSFIVSITKDPDDATRLLLKNFGNPGTQDVSIVGIVTSNQIVIPTQGMNNGWIVEDGSGKFSNAAKTTMNWTYSILIGADKLYLTANAIRQ
jgi:hypothetical protein